MGVGVRGRQTDRDRDREIEKQREAEDDVSQPFSSQFSPYKTDRGEKLTRKHGVREKTNAEANEQANKT